MAKRKSTKGETTIYKHTHKTKGQKYNGQKTKQMSGKHYTENKLRTNVFVSKTTKWT